MLTSKITKRLDIPGEEGEWIKIRMLSGTMLELAEETRTKAVLSTIKAAGGEAFREVTISREDREEIVRQVDPLNDYDVDTLLRFGIVEWSYPDKLSKAIDDLDADTRKWAAQEILAFTKQTEADAKNS